MQHNLLIFNLHTYLNILKLEQVETHPSRNHQREIKYDHSTIINYFDYLRADFSS